MSPSRAPRCLMTDINQPLRSVVAATHGWHLWPRMAWVMLSMTVCTMTAPCPRCWAWGTCTSLRNTTQQKVYTTHLPCSLAHAHWAQGEEKHNRCKKMQHIRSTPLPCSLVHSQWAPAHWPAPTGHKSRDTGHCACRTLVHTFRTHVGIGLAL